MVFKFEKALRPSGCHNASEQTTAYMTGRTANCFEPKRGEVIARVCALRRVFAREHHRATQNTTPRLLLYHFSPSLATPCTRAHSRFVVRCWQSLRLAGARERRETEQWIFMYTTQRSTNQKIRRKTWRYYRTNRHRKSLFWPLPSEDGVGLSVCNLLTHFTITVLRRVLLVCNTAEKFADMFQEENHNVTWS